MTQREQLFYEWMNLKEEIQTITAIVQNPLDQNCMTSIDLAEWKDRCVHFENTYFHFKQKTEEFIVKYLTQPK